MVVLSCAASGLRERTFSLSGHLLSKHSLLSGQAWVVRELDNAIHRINHYPADSVVCFVNIYPVDSYLSCG